jgi:apolipoprotein N-acyltransferase
MLDFALAILSGALLALSFPRFGHPAFAWVALVPFSWRSPEGSRRCAPFTSA